MLFRISDPGPHDLHGDTSFEALVPAAHHLAHAALREVFLEIQGFACPSSQLQDRLESAERGVCLALRIGFPRCISTAVGSHRLCRIATLQRGLNDFPALGTTNFLPGLLVVDGKFLVAISSGTDEFDGHFLNVFVFRISLEQCNG